MGRLSRASSVCLGLALCLVALAQDAAFKIRLTAVPIEAATQADVTGHGSATASLDGRELALQGSFEGLQGAATVARVHMGPVMGVRGEAIHELEVDKGRDGSVSGRVQLSRAQVQALRDGRLYIQIHSERAPDGNLWGWILQ